ncbi:Chloride channel protein CLC-c, partial [Clarias magur]
AVRSQVAVLNAPLVPARLGFKEAGLSQALCAIPPHPAQPPVVQMYGRVTRSGQNPLESSLIAGKKYCKPGTWGRKPG